MEVCMTRIKYEPTTNNQHPTTNLQHPTANDQQPTSNIQQPTSNNQHTTYNIPHPASNSNHPTTTSQQPPSNIQDPTANNQQPATSDQQPTNDATVNETIGKKDVGSHTHHAAISSPLLSLRQSLWYTVMCPLWFQCWLHKTTLVVYEKNIIH
jgi:hypothetical protein